MPYEIRMFGSKQKKIDRKIYSVRFTPLDNLPYQGDFRAESAIGMHCPSRTNPSTDTDDDFQNAIGSPFHVTEVITDYNASTGKQEVLAYEGDYNFSTLVANKTGNRMIEFPSFYWGYAYHTTSTLNRLYYAVCSIDPKPAVFYPSPMHYRNGVMHEKIWVSKYKVNSNFVSQTGEVPVTNTTTTNNGSDTTDYTLARFRNEFRSRGMYCYDYATHCSIIMLMMIKYAEPDVQDFLAYGNCGNKFTNTQGDIVISGRKQNTGVSDSDPRVCCGGYNDWCKCFGIENFYGNIWGFVDGGHLVSPSSFYISNDIEHITSNPTVSNIGNTYLRETTRVRTLSTSTVNQGVIDKFNFYSFDGSHTEGFWSIIPVTPAGPFTIDPVVEINDPLSVGYRDYRINDGYYYDVSQSYNIYSTRVGGCYKSLFAGGPFCIDISHPMNYADEYTGCSAIAIP